MHEIVRTCMNGVQCISQFPYPTRGFGRGAHKPAADCYDRTLCPIASTPAKGTMPLTAKAWKLFLLMPRMLLARTEQRGLQGRAELLGRGAAFQQGDCLQLPADCDRPKHPSALSLPAREHHHASNRHRPRHPSARTLPAREQSQPCFAPHVEAAPGLSGMRAEYRNSCFKMPGPPSCWQKLAPRPGSRAGRRVRSIRYGSLRRFAQGRRGRAWNRYARDMFCRSVSKALAMELMPSRPRMCRFATRRGTVLVSLAGRSAYDSMSRAAFFRALVLAGVLPCNYFWWDSASRCRDIPQGGKVVSNGTPLFGFG